jgi:hypothetical protein
MKIKKQDSLSKIQKEGLITEYNALRSEILRRIDLGNTIIIGTLTFAGVMFGLGITNPILALLYIIISMFLAAAWVQSDVVISQIGRYIRENIERADIGLHWETYLQKTRKEASNQRWKLQPSAIFSMGGVILFTQIVAIMIATSNYQNFTILEWLLSSVALICFFITIHFYRFSKRYENM